jgi:uncharacterized protein YegP (UPF0339 family)
MEKIQGRKEDKKKMKTKTKNKKWKYIEYEIRLMMKKKETIFWMQVYKNKNCNHALKKIKRKKPKIFKVNVILYFNMVCLSNALNVSIHHHLVVVIAQGCATTTRNKFFSLVFVFHYVKSTPSHTQKTCSIFWLEANTTNQQIKASKVTNKQISLMHDAMPFGDDTILHLVAPFLPLKTPTNGAGFVFVRWVWQWTCTLALSSSLAPTRLPLKGCLEYYSGDALIVIVRQFKLHMQTCLITQQPF